MKKKKQGLTNLKLSRIAIGISLASLLVSGSSVYFAFFYKTHELILSPTWAYINYGDQLLECDILFQNTGNTYGSIVGTELSVERAKNNYPSIGDLSIESVPKTSLALLPGEHKVEHVIFRLPSVNFISEWDKTGKARYNISLRIEFVYKDGSIVQDRIPFGQIRFDKSTGIIDSTTFQYKSFVLKSRGSMSSSSSSTKPNNG